MNSIKFNILRIDWEYDFLHILEEVHSIIFNLKVLASAEYPTSGDHGSRLQAPLVEENGLPGPMFHLHDCFRKRCRVFFT